ncbi:MAG: undecaprenyl-diphosphatase [Burkholderiales bacterium]
MNNLELFARLNATAATPHWQITTAAALAQWLIWIIPLALVLAWLNGDDGRRRELLEMLVAALIALGIAQLVTHFWPRPRPFMLHLGTQFLEHSPDPGLPSDHVTVFWSLACAACVSSRLRAWCIPLFLGGLVVGWSRVFLGIHFPYDVAAALPVGALGTLVARSLRAPLQPVYAAALRCWNWAARSILRA